MSTLTATTPEKRPLMISTALRASLIALATILSTAHQGRAQESVGDIGEWDGGYQTTGFGINGGGGDTIVGQTFQINDGDAVVSSISFPVASSGPSIEFQAGVAAWNGTQATGSVLYLSDALSSSSTSLDTFTVTPNNLVLDQNQQYVLFLTASSYLNTDPPFSSGVGIVPSSDFTAGQFYSLTGYQLSINDLFTQSWGSPVPETDLAFNVDYQVVPEPGILALLSSGSLAFCLRNRACPRRM